MRAEPVGDRTTLQFHQIAQAVADSSLVQVTIRFVGEQRGRVGELPADVVAINGPSYRLKAIERDTNVA